MSRYVTFGINTKLLTHDECTYASLMYDDDSFVLKYLIYFEGFTDGSDACCGIGAYFGSGCGNETKGYELCSNPGDYVWFDGAHTTERVNLQLAELIWSGIPNVTGPYNVKQLFGLV